MTRVEALHHSRVQRMELPRVCRGFTTEIKPGRYLIVLNERNSAAEDQRTLEHELAHVRLGHFDSGLSIQECEAEADREAAFILGIGR